MNEVLKPIEELGETPEEFRSRVWAFDSGSKIQASKINVTKRGENFSCCFVSKIAANNAAAAHDHPNCPYEFELQYLLNRCHRFGYNLVLIDESLNEVDRWDCRP